VTDRCVTAMPVSRLCVRGGCLVACVSASGALARRAIPTSTARRSHDQLSSDTKPESRVQRSRGVDATVSRIQRSWGVDVTFISIADLECAGLVFTVVC